MLTETGRDNEATAYYYLAKGFNVVGYVLSNQDGELYTLVDNEILPLMDVEIKDTE